MPISYLYFDRKTIASVKSIQLPPAVNASAIYVFLLLQWLLTAPHSLEKLQAAYKTHPWCGKEVSDDSIRLYLNTLRALGCKIERPTGKNNHRYHLLLQPFTLLNAQPIMDLVVKLFNTLEATTQPELILQRYSTLRSIVKYSGININELTKAIPFITEQPVPVQDLITYTQQAKTALTSYQVTYQPPTYNQTSAPTETWVIIPQGLLQEKGRLYWLVWEIVADQTPRWVQRTLRHDRLLSIEPLVLPTSIQAYFENLATSYVNTLPVYQFTIVCPVGVNFSGLGFPHEQVSLAPNSSPLLMSKRKKSPSEINYLYRVQTDYTFLLIQRLFALNGYFILMDVPKAFQTELQNWSNNTLAIYQ
jgi:hypothetical protein